MIRGKNLSIGYEDKVIIDDFSISVDKGEIISIIGPNGSGKSTILKTISKTIDKSKGVICLEGKDMDSMKIGDIAKKMSILSQHNKTPEDLSVKELIYYGRMPHKRWYESRNIEDEEIVNWAINMTSLIGYEDKKVMSLSGGERQRVWIAMALAQRPKILLLDEPTTYLDICNQLEVLELIKKLNRELNLTVIMVLHDLAQAAKYSDRVIVINNGKKAIEGCPRKVLTEKLIKEVYNVEVCIKKDLFEDEFIIHPIGVCRNCVRECKYENR